MRTLFFLFTYSSYNPQYIINPFLLSKLTKDPYIIYNSNCCNGGNGSKFRLGYDPRRYSITIAYQNGIRRKCSWETRDGKTEISSRILPRKYLYLHSLLALVSPRCPIRGEGWEISLRHVKRKAATYVGTKEHLRSRLEECDLAQWSVKKCAYTVKKAVHCSSRG